MSSARRSYYEDFGNTTFIILPEFINFTICVDATEAELPIEEFEITLMTVKENGVVNEKSMNGTIKEGEQKEFDAKLDETGEIIAIPEFPSWVLAPLLFALTLLGVIFRERRKKIQPRANMRARARLAFVLIRSEVS